MALSLALYLALYLALSLSLSFLPSLVVSNLRHVMNCFAFAFAFASSVLKSEGDSRAKVQELDSSGSEVEVEVDTERRSLAIDVCFHPRFIIEIIKPCHRLVCSSLVSLSLSITPGRVDLCSAMCSCDRVGLCGSLWSCGSLRVSVSGVVELWSC